MRITSLELENIKSYRREAIDFSTGVNAICGLNGSGKTTVLEAIGYTLFDYLPYTQTAFVREGEKTGTIRLRLLAGDDREYEIVRKIGSGGTYHVTDVESGERQADRAENVLKWVREYVLGIEGEADLKALFKNAVGVPQGTMTADFLGTAGARKAIFDPLLRVEEYRHAYDNLLDTSNCLKSLRARLGEEIAGLEAQTERMPELETEITELVERVAAGETALEALAARLVRLEDERASLDEIRQQLDELLIEQRTKQEEVRRHEERLAMETRELEVVREARRIVEASIEGYQRVKEADATLEDLGRRRGLRDAVREQIAEARTRQRGVYGRIEALDRQRTEAVEATEAAGRLSEGVARQLELEQALHDGRARVADLNSAIDKTGHEIGSLERESEGLRRRVDQARRARGEAQKLEDVQRRQQEIGEKLASMAPIRDQLKDLQEEGTELRRQHDELAKQRDRRNQLQVQLEPALVQARDLEPLQTQQQELRERRARVAATIEYSEFARADLARRHCPLLEVQCPVVTADGSMLDKMTVRAEDLSRQLQETDVELAGTDSLVVASQAAAKLAQSLQIQMAQLEGGEAQLTDLGVRLDRCREQFKELSAVVGDEANLRDTHRALELEAKELQESTTLAAQLPVLEGNLEEATHRLEGLRIAVREASEERRAVETQVEAVRTQLDALNDPRGRQQGLLAVAGRLASIEETIRQEEARLERENDQLKVLVAELQTFSSLDEDIEAHETIKSQHNQAYLQYMRYEAKARELEDREQAVKATDMALRQLRAEAVEMDVQLGAVRGRYDGEHHQDVRTRCEDMGKEIAAENERQKRLETDLKQAEDDFELLRRKHKRLMERQAERSELDVAGGALSFIRDTIKAAGPAVTETLLGNISLTANDIYADIMDDHAVELRWDRDYDVVIQRGAEVRNFSQLSGGEQMSAALAVRLALLKEMSEVNVAFFDEPTQNMDSDRRGNLADQIRQVRGFEQLIVISHDDTFEHHTDNLIRLRKVNEETRLDVQ